ncbi:MAG: YitT family protein [Bacteroidaceae bacterium]|nr:YitT family protein [Candidatus Equimonas faecalis]MCQ2205789.1 YitT family protein [Bacteroidaceae bacterium]
MKDWFLVLAGTFVMCLGFVLFINPYSLVPGGTYGCSIVLHSLFPSVQVGTFGYFFDIPLLILSVILLGRRLGTKTLVSVLTTPLIMNGLSLLIYPDEAALQALDASRMLRGCLDLSDHLMLATLMGSVLIGMGCGIVVKGGATSGGSDIVAMIMQKFLNIRFSRALLMVDGGIVLAALGVFTAEALGARSVTSASPVTLMLYSLISIYVIAWVVARTINGSKDDKMLFVISGGDLQPLHDFILGPLDRTATLLPATGLYEGADKEMLCIVVPYKQVDAVKRKVQETDPSAFVIVTDAYDTYGSGWKSLPKDGDVEAE